MEQTLLAAIHTVLGWLALPEIGLSAIFFVSFVSATLLPLGSEPAVYAYVKVSPDMFWPAILIATVGNTLGGLVNYAMGWGAHRGVERWREHHGREASRDGAEGSSTDEAPKDMMKGRWHAKARAWLTRLGPPALLLAWLPVVGDPMCAVAGWLRLSFWPCVVYMAIGKFLRYLTMTAGLLWATSGVHL